MGAEWISLSLFTLIYFCHCVAYLLREGLCGQCGSRCEREGWPHISFPPFHVSLSVHLPDPVLRRIRHMGRGWLGSRTFRVLEENSFLMDGQTSVSYIISTVLTQGGNSLIIPFPQPIPVSVISYYVSPVHFFLDVIFVGSYTILDFGFFNFYTPIDNGYKNMLTTTMRRACLT